MIPNAQQFVSNIEQIAAKQALPVADMVVYLGTVDAMVWDDVSQTFVAYTGSAPLANPRIQWDGEPTLDDSITESYPMISGAKVAAGDRVAAVRSGGTRLILGQTSLDGSTYTPMIGELVTKVNQASGTQSIPNNTARSIFWNAKNIDKTSSVDVAGANPERWTCTIPGHYEFYGMIGWSANATGYRQAGFFLNGNSQNGTFVSGNGTNASVQTGLLIRPTSFQLIVGDYVQVVVQQNSGIALDTGAGGFISNLMVKYVGR